jgi:hypothetical protein
MSTVERKRPVSNSPARASHSPSSSSGVRDGVAPVVELAAQVLPVEAVDACGDLGHARTTPRHPSA